MKPRGREKTINIWLGLDFFAWVKFLFRNRFQVQRNRIPLAIGITFASMAHTLLRWTEGAVYGRRVARTEIKDHPLFIIGHWRTGTTLLHELLGLDERHTYPTTYECFDPNHFLLTEKLVAPLLKSRLPAARPMDNMAVGTDRPQEDEFALANLGFPSPVLTVAFPKMFWAYTDYFELDWLPPLKLKRWKNAYLRFLRRITLAHPGRIVLKSPYHTFRIKVLLELFPRARFVHIVRNPYVVFPSTVHALKSMIRQYGLQSPDFKGLEEQVFNLFNRMYEKLEATRGLIPPFQFHELRYEDLIDDPIGELRRLYRKLKLGGFEAFLPRLKEYLDGVANYRPNYYELTPEVRAEISRHWDGVIRRYGYSVKNEPAGDKSLAGIG